MSQAGIKANVGPGSGLVRYLQGDSGGLVGPNAAQTIFVVGGNNITVAGNPGIFTETISVTGTTNHSVLLGNATGSINSLVNGTTGQVLHAITGANDPVWSAVSLTADVSGVLPIANGGTNANAMANTFGVNYFDGTRIVTTAVGTATHVLTSNGVGVAPTFQVIPVTGVTSITGNTGAALTGALNLVTLNSNIVFAGLVTTQTLDFALTSNLLLGTPGSIAGGVDNVAVGKSAGASISSGSENTAMGYQAMVSSTTGSYNTSIGSFSMFTAGIGATNNTAVGYSSLYLLATGDYNCCIGDNSGSALTLADSSNIMIVSAGTAGDSNTIRIGRPGGGASQQNRCFIVGIDGVNIGSVAKVVTMASDQLGTAAITAGAGISVTPGANLITIAATGMGAFAWSVITVNQTIVVNNGYITNKAGTLALLLPATAVVGDIIKITGIQTATGWQITQNANQQIFLGAGSTSVGVGGSVTTTAVRDSIELVCVVAGASTVWNAISWVGNLTIV